MSAKICDATVLLSGGIDSAACASMLLEQGYRVDGLFIDYGQAAAKPEALAAARIADHFALPFTQVSLSGASAFGRGEVTGRNAFFLFTALLVRGRASRLLALGIHGGTSYYDCSKQFLSTMQQSINEHTDRSTTVVAPFVDWSKKDVVEYARQKNLPFDLTYSCEAGTQPVCGTCASCRDREALKC